MNRAAIGKELTNGTDSWLRARRRIAAIAGALAADFAVIGMRQYGVIRHLPDLPIRGFDSNAVITSPAAYPAGIPDGALAVAGLGGIIALATAGGSKKTGRSRWFDRALFGALAIGAAGAAHYLDEMLRKQRRLCAYCLVGAAGFFAMGTIAALQRRT
jgi:uncharacterized membrane protein